MVHIERNAIERRWSEYRRRDGQMIRRALQAPRSRLSPRAIATIRASRLDAGLLALLFDISDDMVKSIRCGRRLAKMGRDCEPIPDGKLLRMALAWFSRMMRAVSRE